MTNMNPTFRQPEAFVPIVMSLLALALVLIYILLFGIPHETDEGAVAHIWQLLIVLQVPIIAYFAIRNVRQRPRQALPILALQIVAALIACAPVYLLKM